MLAIKTFKNMYRYPETWGNLDSWLFYPLADCPPDGSYSMDEPPYELSTGF